MDDNWAVMYLAWMNRLPLSDTIWRFEANKKMAELGHSGDCTKEPHTCAVCLLEECREGGEDMRKAWEVRASQDS